jgi:chaperonin cofactor prefoldin
MDTISIQRIEFANITLNSREGNLIELSKAELELRLRGVGEQEDRLRRRLNELEDIVQNAPGSHRPGYPSAQTL